MITLKMTDTAPVISMSSSSTVFKMTERELELAEMPKKELKQKYASKRQEVEKSFASVPKYWVIPVQCYKKIEDWLQLPLPARRGWINYMIAQARYRLTQFDSLENERKILANFLDSQNKPLIMTRELCSLIDVQATELMDEAELLYALAYYLIKQGQKGK